MKTNLTPDTEGDLALVEPVVSAEIYHLGDPMPHEVWTSCDGVMAHVGDFADKHEAEQAADKIETGQYVVEDGLVRRLSDIESICARRRNRMWGLCA